MPLFTDGKLWGALRKLKTKRAKESKGLIAEIIHVESTKLRSILLDLMNLVISPNAFVPDEWRRSVCTQGRPPQHYRPICVLPLLYATLGPKLQGARCKDQTGFRRLHSTLDHTHAFSLIQDKTEFQIPVWIAGIDLQKAVKSMERKAILETSASHGVGAGYVYQIRKTDMHIRDAFPMCVRMVIPGEACPG